MEELWIDIKGFEGIYQVSNLGRVKSLKRTIINNGGKSKTPTKNVIKEKFLKCSPCSVGYPRVRLRKDKKTYPFHVHKLVALTFLENTNEYRYINHIDGNKLNNNSKNLEWCSQSQNCIHAFDIGLNHHGEKHHNSKLNEKQVAEIRQKYNQGNTTHRKLAKEYNVCYHTIYQVLNYISWRRLSN